MSFDIRISGEQVVYGRIEISFEKECPIDYVTVLTPSGRTETVFPFQKRFVDFIYSEEGWEDTLVGEDFIYACRYTPEEIGDYTVKACKDGACLSSRNFRVSKGEDHGYIEVSKKDCRYFSYTDGTPFFWLGINLCFPTAYEVSDGMEFGRSDAVATLGLRQYERWFKKCAENGVSVVRIWIGHSYFTPDAEETYRFCDAQWEKIDRIVSLARQYHIKLKLTLEHFRDFKNNNQPPIFRKSLLNGGVACQNMKEWLTSEAYQKAWLYKVEELSKRYRGDPTVCMIELWNEMNAVNAEKDLVIAWNEKFLPRVKELFPRQLVTNSIGSLDAKEVQEYYRAFCWEKSDVLQVHRYLDQGARHKICGGDVIPSVQEALSFMLSEKKPLLLAETGAVNNRHSGEFRFYSCDDRGIIFVDSVYTPLFSGSAGCGNIWHWDRRYVESKNLYPYFAPLAKLVENVDFTEEAFSAEDLSTDDAYILLLKGKTVTLGFIRNKKDSWRSSLRDGAPVASIEKISLPITVTSAKLYPIWEEDTTHLRIENRHPVFENLLYGVLFRCV